MDAAVSAGPRAPGRPRSTDDRAVEVAALRLFARDGFEHTTVDAIAAAAGVSRRTFFRYFPTKASVLWRDFDHEVENLTAALAAAPPDRPLMDAVRDAVVGVNSWGPQDVPELRTRMHLIATAPELAASATPHYAAWEDAVAAFVGRRTGRPADSLFPLAVARATLATARAAFDRWLQHGTPDLTVYLDAGLTALGAGFAPDALGPDPH